MTAQKLCRCVDCGRTWADSEEAFRHVTEGCPERPLMIRRRGLRRRSA